MRLPRRLAAVALGFLAALPASAADLYGKPLRGLSPVAARAIVQDPARYAAKAVRVEGANAGAAGSPALKDGDAVLPIVSDGSFKLPADVAGGLLAAEGRARASDSGVVFVATGVEVQRGAPAR
ncbi:MAG TPA: hypothetical protein VFZ57_02425 [Thermoanaerobaculia bacterium]|nr:hypothetical protein [Thermoanaerobaculia bacterium]